MPVHLTIGVNAAEVEVVSAAWASLTGTTGEPHESSYLGIYDLFRIPEEVKIKYNFVSAQQEWDHPGHQQYAVLIEAGATEDPERLKKLAARMPFTTAVIKEKAW